MACDKPPVVFPVTLLIDSREQLPYSFAGITADKKDGGGIVSVPTRVEKLRSGDYSLDGFADRVAVERKSLADLFGTLGRGRARFERELARLNEMDAAFVVVESEWSEVVGQPPAHSRMSPKSIHRSVMAYLFRYPKVHWWFVPGRSFAERTTLRLLERYFIEINKGES